MKIFPAIFCAALLISSSSYATGAFIGADALWANARHQAKNPSTTAGTNNGSVQQSDKVGYGVNAGVRADFLILLASAELFYDKLDTSTRNFESTSGAINNSDSIAIKNRYGVKGNIGLSIFPKVTPFLTYGLANVQYGNQVSSSGSISKSEFAPLYGLGVLIDLPFTGLSVKAAYDYQQFNMRSAQEGAKIRTHLGVARLGLVYNF